MKKLELRELQLLQLEIAKEFKRICEENNISYFMDGGTLLGAIRHKGFIPWDDDMDFGMTLDNYIKFMQVAIDELDDKYIIQHWNDGTDYAFPFCKIKMKNTVVIEKVIKHANIDKGIWIDVFPYVRITKEQYNSRYYMLKLQLISKMLLLKSNYDLSSLTERMSAKVLNIILKKIPINKKFLKNKLSSLIFSSNYVKDCCYMACDGMFKGDFIYKTDYFSEYKFLTFENIEFQAPRYSEAYLKDTYGDYMQLPPENQRYNGHSLLDVYIDM